MSDDRSEPETTTEGEGALARWSRRKTEARQAPQAVQEPAEAEALPPGDEDMPPLESLDEDSDYSPFLSPRVSEELQRLALRKLFRGSAFSLRDGLDDYDEDFTTFTSLGSVVTAELRRRLRLEAERLADATGGETRAGIDETAAPDEPGCPEDPAADDTPGDGVRT